MKKIVLSIITLSCISLGIQAQVAKHNAFDLRNKQNQLSPERGVNWIKYNPGKEVASSWDTTANAWSFQDSTRNTYNSSGNVTLSLKYYGSSTYPSKTIHIYNANGKVTSDTSKHWNGNSYYNGSITIYTYDVNNNLTQELYQYWNFSTNSWVNSYKATHTWSAGQLIEDMGQSWDANTSAFLNSYKNGYTYTGGVLTAVTSYSWNGTSWFIEAKYINVVWYQWSGNMDESLLSGYTEQVQNGSVWKDTIKYSFTYDSFGNQTDMLEQSKPSTTYITTGETKNSYLYDSNNNVTQDIEQSWVNATIGLRNTYKREYSNYQLFTSIQQLTTNDLQLSVYPNPFNSQTTITINENIKNGNIKIMDILGKEIKTFNFPGKEFVIEKGEMKEGIYFIQLTDDNKNVVIKKIIIQ